MRVGTSWTGPFSDSYSGLNEAISLHSTLAVG